jgi:hypothetical protein
MQVTFQHRIASPDYFDISYMQMAHIDLRVYISLDEGGKQYL